MKAVRLTLRNVLPFEALTLDFGEHITYVRGANGTGKTSLKDALLSFSDGGSDPTLLRAGATAGEAVWLLSDDGQPWTLRERITPSKTSRDVIRPDGSTEGAAMTVIRELINSMSANPVKFIQSPPETRARIFIEQMQVKLTPERLAAAGITDYPPALLQSHGLEAIKQLDKMLRSKREGVGGSKRRAAETAETLRKQLPPDRPNINQELETARAELAGKQGELAARKKDIGDMVESQRKEIEAKYREQHAYIERQIEALRSKARELESAERAELSQLSSDANQQYARYRAALASEIETLTGTVATLQEQYDQQTRAQQTKAHIERNQVDAEELQAQWDALSKQIQQLEVIEAELLQGVPIKNVEVRDGEIYRDGVPFPRWNEERQWALAFQIAKMVAGKLGFVSVDGIQFMDPMRRESFERAAIASGLQFLVTEVNVNCQCGHPHSVHGPTCTVTGCECEGYVDPGMVVERVGEIPPLFEMTPAAAPETRRRRRG